jgi:hypothetical protein
MMSHGVVCRAIRVCLSWQRCCEAPSKRAPQSSARSWVPPSLGETPARHTAIKKAKRQAGICRMQGPGLCWARQCACCTRGWWRVAIKAAPALPVHTTFKLGLLMRCQSPQTRANFLRKQTQFCAAPPPLSGVAPEDRPHARQVAVRADDRRVDPRPGSYWCVSVAPHAARKQETSG